MLSIVLAAQIICFRFRFVDEMKQQTFSSVFLCRSRKPKGEPKQKKSGDERLGAKQRMKIKSKAFVSSSEDSSDSETEKLKIADE